MIGEESRIVNVGWGRRGVGKGWILKIKASREYVYCVGTEEPRGLCVCSPLLPPSAGSARQ